MSEAKSGTGSMFNTSWLNPDWGEGKMDEGAMGREVPEAPSAGEGKALHAIFDYGTDEHPCRCFIAKFEPGAVIHPHEHPTDYCSMVVEGSLEMRGEHFSVGDIRFVKANTFYGPIVMGPQGCTMVEFHPGPLDPVFAPYARKVFTAPWVRMKTSPANDR